MPRTRRHRLLPAPPAAVGACLATALLLIAAEAALAHRSPGSTTVITWNERSGLLEITHRLHVHDAELGVEEVLGAGRLSVARREDQARIALYVEERFAIELDGEPVALRTLGAELAGEHLLIYQESDTRLALDAVRVRNGILLDAFARQVNEVFLRDGDQALTLRFQEGDVWQPRIVASAQGTDE